MITKELVDKLEYQWSGEIELNNGLIIPIWWTAWAPWRARGFKRVVNVYSDLPKVKINK